MTVSSIRPSRTQEIVATVNRLGLVKAATELSIPQSTLCMFLKREGYRRKQQYVKEGQSIHQFQPT